MSQQKRVSFQDSATIVDEHGEVPEMDAVDEVNEIMDGLKLKKKKKKVPKEEDSTTEPAVDGDGDSEIDLSSLKKKKKKKKPATDDDFEAKLKEAGRTYGEATTGEEAAIEEGDMDKGTGIWAHDSTQVIPYNMLLSRFFTLLHAHHPDLASSGGKSYKIPPPQCLREGNKKTIFANIAKICKRMKRNDEHVT